MNGYIISIMSLIAVVSVIAMFWYLFQTLRIMWGYSALVAIAAVLFSPLVHIVFYLLPKEEFDSQEKRLFNMYFLSIGAVAIIGIVAIMVVPTTTQTQSDQNDAYQSAESEAHLSRIYEAHPDADDIVDSAKFKNWWQSKPDVERRDYERVLYEGNSSEVIHMLTLFKIENGGQ